MKELDNKCFHISLATADLLIIFFFPLCFVSSSAVWIKNVEMATNSKNIFVHHQITWTFISDEDNGLRGLKKYPIKDAYVWN